MKTKPYIIDDVVYHVPERVAEDINKMTCEIYDQRGALKDKITENGKLTLRIEDLKRHLLHSKQGYNKLLEDYKELKKENSYLIQIINRLEGGQGW